MEKQECKCKQPYGIDRGLCPLHNSRNGTEICRCVDTTNDKVNPSRCNLHADMLKMTSLLGGADVSIYELSMDMMKARAEARMARIRLAEDALDVAMTQVKADLAEDILDAAKMGLWLPTECRNINDR